MHFLTYTTVKAATPRQAFNAVVDINDKENLELDLNGGEQFVAALDAEVVTTIDGTTTDRFDMSYPNPQNLEVDEVLIIEDEPGLYTVHSFYSD